MRRSTKIYEKTMSQASALMITRSNADVNANGYPIKTNRCNVKFTPLSEDKETSFLVYQIQNQNGMDCFL